MFKQSQGRGGGRPPGIETGDGHIRFMVADNSHKTKRVYSSTHTYKAHNDS